MAVLGIVRSPFCNHWWQLSWSWMLICVSGTCTRGTLGLRLSGSCTVRIAGQNYWPQGALVMVELLLYSQETSCLSIAYFF